MRKLLGRRATPKAWRRIAGGRAPRGTPKSSRKTWRREHHRYRFQNNLAPRRGAGSTMPKILQIWKENRGPMAEEDLTGLANIVSALTLAS